MSRYAPVAPVEVLLQLKERGFIDNYMLLLAHEVVQKPDQYTKLLEDFEGTVILDNSLIELGHPVPTDVMLTAASIVKPTFAVLPDKLGDRQETVRMAADAMDSWVKRLPSGTGLMIAAQGESAEEAVWCVEEIVEQSTNKRSEKDRSKFLVGVPRNVANVQGSRVRLTQLLVMQGYQVHLLGMSNFLYDDIQCAKMFGVRGIDSASPLRAGWEGKRFDGSTDWMRPRDEYFDECRGLSINMAYNIGEIRGQIGENR